MQRTIANSPVPASLMGYLTEGLVHSRAGRTVVSVDCDGRGQYQQAWGTAAGQLHLEAEYDRE